MMQIRSFSCPRKLLNEMQLPAGIQPPFSLLFFVDVAESVLEFKDVLCEIVGEVGGALCQTKVSVFDNLKTSLTHQPRYASHL